MKNFGRREFCKAKFAPHPLFYQKFVNKTNRDFRAVDINLLAILKYKDALCFYFCKNFIDIFS